MNVFKRLSSWISRGRAIVSGAAPTQTADQYFKAGAAGTWTPVKSSNVAAVAYHRDVTVGGSGGTLGIKFLNGSVYAYPGRSYSDYTNVLAASSKGQWVHRNLVRPKATYRRVV